MVLLDEIIRIIFSFKRNKIFVFIIPHLHYCLVMFDLQCNNIPIYQCLLLVLEMDINLDNSDWFVKTANKLRNKNLIQIDMHGFGPINAYTWCTSIFLTRDFNFNKKYTNQPEHGIGSLIQYANENV